jgi:tetraacyldisaccharide 4'-kinase
LRERRAYAKEAGIILITQCPANASEEKKQEIEAKVREYNADAPLFFTTYTHGKPYRLGKPEESLEQLPQKASLCCGIDRPVRFRESAESAGIEVIDFLSFKDHHRFSEADLAKVHALPSPIITTEKDAQRLQQHLDVLSETEIWVWPLEVTFLGKEALFWEEVLAYCKENEV